MSCLVCFLFICIICQLATKHIQNWNKSLYCSRNARNGRTYGIFFQSMLRRDLICMQSCQSLHCSHTYTQWVCLWHILSVSVQTSLSMRAASPEPSLLSHMRKVGLHTAYSFSQCSDEPYCVCSLPALAHARNRRTYDIFFSQCSDET